MLAQETLICPTCRAEQTWSDTCRRCKCDLGLVVDTLRLRDALHHECLRHMEKKDPEKAFHCARRRWELSPDKDAARLLAVCLAMRGEYSLVERLIAAFDNRRAEPDPEMRRIDW